MGVENGVSKMGCRKCDRHHWANRRHDGAPLRHIPVTTYPRHDISPSRQPEACRATLFSEAVWMLEISFVKKFYSQLNAMIESGPLNFTHQGEG
jgi:hypothetical protein